MLSDFFVITPFNVPFFVIIALTAALGFFLIFFNRNKDERTRRRVVVILYSLTVLLFFVYKFALSLDKPYSELRVDAGLGAFNFWDELPLNLCNINMILIVIGVLTKSRTILSFNFFFGTLGALFPIFMPVVGFTGYGFFMPRVFGYYVTHLIILLELPLLAGLKLYRPKFRDILPTVGVMAGITALMTGVNFLLRGTGLSEAANYFYTVNPSENPLLELFYKWIPCPGLYVLPCALIAVPYMLIVTAQFELSDRRKAKNEKSVREDVAPVSAE